MGFPSLALMWGVLPDGLIPQLSAACLHKHFSVVVSLNFKVFTTKRVMTQMFGFTPVLFGLPKVLKANYD